MSKISEKAKELIEQIRAGKNVDVRDLDEVLSNFYGSPKSKDDKKENEENKDVKKEEVDGKRPKLTDPLVAAELDMKYRELTGYDHKQIIENLQASINVATEIYGSQAGDPKGAGKMKQLQKVQNELINRGLYERNKNGTIVRVERDRLEKITKEREPKIIKMLKESPVKSDGKTNESSETNTKTR